MELFTLGLALALCMVAYMVIGAFWYSSLAFGPLWQKLSKLDLNPNDPQFKKDFQRAMIVSPLAALVTSGVMMYFMQALHIHTVIDGLFFAFVAWLGFVAPIALQAVLYAKKPFKLYLIKIGYDLATLLAMGAILGYFIA